MLDIIPHEIFRAIVDQIPDNRDRNSISQVSKKLYALALPTLYESIIIRSRDESNLAQTDIDKFLQTANRDYFTYVKSITFFARIEANDKFRCIHYNILSMTDRVDIDDRDEELVSRVNELGDLMPQIRPLFQGLPDNQLRSFHWHLGTCVPQEILGPGGYLPTRQRGIEDLSLITSDPCIVPYQEWDYPISLTEFESLKKFSWCGGLSREDFDALRDMLRTHSNNLEVLKLDLVDWWDAQWNWATRSDEHDLREWIRDHNFFGEKVLGLAPGETHVLFPSLKSLSFSSIQFQSWSLEMAHAFNVSRLHSLNLRNCPHSESLLRMIVESGDPINLRSLELVAGTNSDDSSGEEAENDWIVLFLNSFEGLTNLHLHILNGKAADTPDRYWPTIFHHQKSLTRLVYHEHRTDGYLMDRNTSMEDNKILDLFSQMNIECLGLCLSPIIPKEEAFSQLTLAQVSTLKFLCLRTTRGVDQEHEYRIEDGVVNNNMNYEFARWAFNKFSNLLFIAIGDFSYGHKFPSYQEVLHRHPFPGVDSYEEVPDHQPVASQNQSDVGGFRQLETRDHRFSCHLEQFREVLEACPTEPLYEKDF